MSNRAMQDELERQKEDNNRIGLLLKENELDVKTVETKVINTNAARKTLEFKADDLNMNLNKKLGLLDQVSRQRLDVIAAIQNSSTELDKLCKDDHYSNLINIDMDQQIQRL